MKIFVVSVEEDTWNEVSYEVETTCRVLHAFSTRNKAELWVFENYSLTDDSLSMIGPAATEPCDVFFDTSGLIICIEEVNLD